MGTVHAIRTADTRGIRREHRSDRFQARPSIDDRSRAGFIRRGSVGEMASDGIGGRRVLDWHGRGLVPCVVCDRGSTVTLLSGPGLRWVLRRAESSELVAESLAPSRWLEIPSLVRPRQPAAEPL
jgi:hypothetical protein